MTDQETTLWDRIKGVREEINERLEDEPDQDAGDLAFEVADNWCPIYTGEIMQYAAEDISLAVNEPELGPAFDGKPTPVNIVAANIFERLHEEAQEEIRRLGKEE